jgi:hypothetical protein
VLAKVVNDNAGLLVLTQRSQVLREQARSYKGLCLENRQWIFDNQSNFFQIRLKGT